MPARTTSIRRPANPKLCAGWEPALLPSCGTTAPPCAFTATTKLSDGAQNNDDLLDCMSCQTEDAALTVARELYGANPCCVGDDCSLVRTRRACLREAGDPAFYRTATIAEPMSAPHAIAIDGDGTVYVADTGTFRIKKITPQGQSSVFARVTLPPYDVSVDSNTGEVYMSARCTHQVVKVAPGGSLSVVAGTGVAGHAGDGGTASAARLLAPNKSAVDPDGNIFFTESGFLSQLCAGHAFGSERIRKADGDRKITILAGNSSFSADGAGGTGGAGGPAVDASLGIPSSVETGPGGTVLIGESGMGRALRIEADQTLTHVAGLPMAIVGAYSGDARQPHPRGRPRGQHHQHRRQRPHLPAARRGPARPGLSGGRRGQPRRQGVLPVTDGESDPCLDAREVLKGTLGNRRPTGCPGRRPTTRSRSRTAP